MSDNTKPAKYWEARKDAIYLFAARMICNKYAGVTHSVIDIGSNRCPTLEWHRNYASELTSIDLRNPYTGPGIISIADDFLSYEFDKKFDLATCFQVLEHVSLPEIFAQKLLEVAKILVVSVPYKWPLGACKYHINDPVDNKKMFEWFKRNPSFSYIAREFSKKERLIHVYREKRN